MIRLLDPALDLIPDPHLFEATIFLNHFETASLLDQPVVILMCWHFQFLLYRLFFIKGTKNSVFLWGISNWKENGQKRLFEPHVLNRCSTYAIPRKKSVTIIDKSLIAFDKE